MRRAILAATALLLAAAAPQSAPPAPPPVPVTADPALGDHLSGRLIVFAEPVSDGTDPNAPVDFSPFGPTGAWIAAREVTDMRAALPVLIDSATDAYPGPLAALAPGRYRMQAVLDRNHDYNYAGRGAGDLVSAVTEVTLPGPLPTLRLREALPAEDPDAFRPDTPAERRAELTALRRRLQPIEFQSNALTRFRGTPTFIRGWVALPPGYDGKRRFPTVYWDSGFGGTLAYGRQMGTLAMEQMAKGKAAPMIWVLLDHSGATGTHEFADSVNNGPWGKALTEELIPALEKRYAMDAKPAGRFLTGHSSGGWSTLWLQVRYPKLFGGSWPTAPDPSDFHDFTNIDLYAPGVNFYHDAAGKERPLVRADGKVIATMAQFARAEHVLGGYGGQIASFEWVFSPRGANGMPVPLFDRATGAVDPAVVGYWRDNYDIAHIVKRDAAALRRDLSGKLHLTVGTADTFYLDGPAHLLEAAMREAKIPARFTYRPDRTHGNLLERDGDRNALLWDFTWEMLAIARPGSRRPK